MKAESAAAQIHDGVVLWTAEYGNELLPENTVKSEVQAGPHGTFTKNINSAKPEEEEEEQKYCPEIFLQQLRKSINMNCVFVKWS